MSLFSCFYDFVFFICREKGQKSVSKILYPQILVYTSYPHRTLTGIPIFTCIAIQRAVAAWRIVLSGRFRLLDRWCNFVEVQKSLCLAMIQNFQNWTQICVVLVFVFMIVYWSISSALVLHSYPVTLENSERKIGME